MPRPTEIPTYVYDALRAVHESRAKRHNADVVIPHLPNSIIFIMMPDHRDINWNRGEQQDLIDQTLEAMSHTLR